MSQIIYAGIDEAGYGPRLGPLCMGLCAIRFDAPLQGVGEGLPDLWRVLSGIVDRGARGYRKGLIPVADSKKLKLPNSGKRHPLTMLEPGVLAFLAQRCEHPSSDGALFDRLGIRFARQAWYAGQGATLPVSTTTEHIGLMSARLQSGMTREGLECVALSCAALSASELNEHGERLGSKAAVSFCVIGRMLRALVDRFGGVEQGCLVRAVVDRQGGRISYGRELLDVFPGASLRVVRQGAEESVYELSTGNGGAVFAEIRFVREAEETHLPVAVASMTAKYVRELAMARFNTYFGSRMAELKPTAGYATDAARWLKDAAGILDPEERRAIVRRR